MVMNRTSVSVSVCVSASTSVSLTRVGPTIEAYAHCRDKIIERGHCVSLTRVGLTPKCKSILETFGTCVLRL